jgi:hypothetical protein
VHPRPPRLPVRRIVVRRPDLPRAPGPLLPRPRREAAAFSRHPHRPWPGPHLDRAITHGPSHAHPAREP